MKKPSPPIAPAPTISCAAVSSTRIVPCRNDSTVNMAVYQITVSPAAMPNSATSIRRTFPG